MAAYAVMARIGRIDPHLTMREVEEEPDSRPPAGLAADHMAEVATVEVATVESDRMSEPGPYAERVTRIMELWRQTTFFLFDADSWRA